MNIPELNEKLKSFLNEDVMSIDNALIELQNTIEEAKHSLDECYKRVVYRTKENVSYVGNEALDKIYDVIEVVQINSQQTIDKVYNEIIG